MNLLHKAIAKTNLGLFQPLNPKKIVVFRLFLALMLAYMYAPRGLSPGYPLNEFSNFNQYFFSDSYYILIYVLITLFALGVQSQIISILLFLVLFPHEFLPGGRASKQIVSCVLLCFAFIKTLPVWKMNQRSLQISQLSPIWPVRLMQIQLSLLYGVNAIAKTTYNYLSGNVLIEMSKSYENFHIDLSDGFLQILDLSIPAYLLAILTVFIEYFLALGFWFKKTKWITICLGVLFHFTLSFVLTIFMLDYASVFLYLLFIIPFKLKKQ